MDIVIFDNPMSTWLRALALAAAVTLGLYAFKVLLVRRLGAWAALTETRLDDIVVAALDATHFFILAIVGLYAGSTMLTLPPDAVLFLKRVAITAGLIQTAIWADSALRGWLAQYRSSHADDPGRATSTAAIGFIARFAVWAVLILMVLDNLGFNITTLVASLGIGGIAVALAVQNVLGDLFASLSIVLDKPFVIGDVINVGGVFGTVEYVGLKTTRVRSLGGEQIIYSNADLLRSRIHNLRRMETRRVVLTVAVTFDTPQAKLRAVPGMLAAIIKDQEQVTFDRAHFVGVGPSAFNFEAVYIVNTADYLMHMDIQQEVYFRLVQAFAEQAIRFALPAQTLHLVATDVGAQARLPPNAGRPPGTDSEPAPE